MVSIYAYVVYATALTLYCWFYIVYLNTIIDSGIFLNWLLNVAHNCYFCSPHSGELYNQGVDSRPATAVTSVCLAGRIALLLSNAGWTCVQHALLSNCQQSRHEVPSRLNTFQDGRQNPKRGRRPAATLN
jgi:hypothetical protein